LDLPICFGVTFVETAAALKFLFVMIAIVFSTIAPMSGGVSGIPFFTVSSQPLPVSSPESDLDFVHLFWMVLSPLAGLPILVLMVGFIPFLVFAVITDFACGCQTTGSIASAMKVVQCNGKPLTAFSAALVRNRLVDHLKRSFAGLADRCGQAAKQAVRTVHDAVLVHTLNYTSETGGALFQI
jgi:hypothetical protein